VKPPSFLAGAALGALFLGAALPCAAETWAERGTVAPPLPLGLSSVWRVDGRKVDSRAAAWSIVAFSTDGKLVGVSDERGTRVYGAGDGRLLRMFPAPLATGQFAFSLAISSTGLVAVGRVGGLDVYTLEGNGDPLKFYCGGVCGPVSALAFAPNGAWLAYQAARSAREPTPGLVDVVDLGARKRVAQLEASTMRTGVLFASDGRTLVAANVTHIDDSGTFGVRAWNGGAQWRRTRDVRGAAAPRGSIGPFAFDERAAVYSRAGWMELRELATGAVVWGVGLVPPGLDATGDVPMKLDLVALARPADLVLSYESPAEGEGPGAIVLRRLSDGVTLAMYDVRGVSALALAPDGGSFVYSTGAGRTYTAVARVPR